MGRAKPLIPVAGVPLVVRVVRAARAAVDEVVVVTKRAKAGPIRSVLPEGVRVHTDSGRVQSPLVGFVAGADALGSEYVAFLPCDLPLLSPGLLTVLFEKAEGHDAAIPRWPDGRIEPMVAVYLRSPARDAALEALEAGDRANTDLLRRLLDVVYVPVAELRAVDPELDSFVNVNTPADLKAVEHRLRRRA
jgi:molybdopterin-guanine dinucleotide biosynthesis protein A